jgi:hypothetical protein
VTWDAAAARARSVRQLAHLGYVPPPDWYPPIDERPLRTINEIENRALALNVMINCAYGMPTAAARNWLTAHELLQALTPKEAEYLDAIDHGLQPDSQGHRLQVERLWALVWTLSFVETLDWSTYCADNLASIVPNLREAEGTDRLRTTAKLRSGSDVLDQADLAFCITWSCAESNLKRTPHVGAVDQYVIWERRSAIEWLLGDDWDHPDLST